MPNPKSKRRLKILGACALLGVLVLGAVWVTRKYQIRREYASYRSEGLAAAAAGDHDRALELLGKYVGRHPTDIDVLLAYAHARQLSELPKNAHLVQTIQILLQILRLDPNRIEQRRELLALYGKAGRAVEALNLADEFLKGSPSDLDALRQRAVSLVALRRLDDATTAARLWAEADRNNFEAQLLLIQLLVSTKNPAAATKYADGLVRSGMNEDAVLVLRGLARLQTGGIDEAKPMLTDAAAHSPKEKLIVFALTDALDRVGLSEQSLKVVRAAAASGDTEIRQRLLRRTWQSGDLNGYLELVGTPASSPEQRWAEETGLMLVSLRRLGRSAEAEVVEQVLKSRHVDLANAWLMAADTLGGVALGQGVARELRDRCLAALERDPGNPFLVECLAEADRVLGESDEALRRFEDLTARNPGWLVPLLRLAELELDRGQVEEALAVATEAFNRTSHNVRTAGILARVWEAAIDAGKRNNVAELLQFVEEIQKAMPGEEDSIGVAIRQLSKAGKSDEAKAALKKVLSDEKATPTEAALLSWADASRKYELGLEQQCADRCQQLHGLTPRLGFLKAYLAFAAGRGEEGLKVLQGGMAAASTQPSSASDWAIAEARYLDLMQSPQAISAWAKLSASDPTNAGLQRSVLASPSVLRDRALQAEVVERLRQAAGEQNDFWKLARARMLATGSLSDVEAREASSLLNDVLKAAPDSVEVRFLLARCLEKLGNRPQAIEHLSAATRLAPDSRPVLLYLAQLLQQSGDYTRAKQYLDRVSLDGSSDLEDRRHLAILLAEQGDSSHAADLLQDSQGQSRDADVLLAKLYFRMNDPERAQAILQKLLQTPDLDVIRLAADLYATMGRTSEAHYVLSKLDSLDVDSGLKAAVRAGYEVKHGDARKSIDLLRNATAQNARDPAAWRSLVSNLILQSKVAAALDAAAQGSKELPNDEVLSGILKRSVLIRYCAERGLLPLAIGLTQTPDDLALVDAATQLTSSDMESPSRALVDLAQLAARHPRSLLVQVVVIDRYLAFNRPREAADLAIRVTQAFPLAPEPPRQATIAFTALADLSQALVMAKTWKDRLGSNALEADLTYSNILVQMGKDDDAAAVLKPYTVAASDRPSEVSAAVSQYAATLYRLGRVEQADSVLHQLLHGGGPVFMAWAQAASIELPRDQAGAWIDRLRKLSDNSVESSMAIAVANGTLGKRFGDDERLATAKQLLTELPERPGLPAAQLLSVGIYLEAIGDAEDAEKVYRRLAAADDPEGIARNNLSMILGRRGQLVEAISYAKLAVQTAPDRTYALDTLAFVQRKSKDFDGACSSLQEAIHREPWAIEWRLTLAETLAEAGKSQDAKAQISAIFELVPDQSKLSEGFKQRLRSLQQGIGESAIGQRWGQRFDLPLPVAN